jgi:hypothetical protein
MERCRRTECDVIYDWRKIFVSIPYGNWFAESGQEIKRSLHSADFNPVVVERELNPIPLTEAITKKICSCGLAVVDLSTDDQGRFAGGVLMENGFLRCTMGSKSILLVAREGSELPAEAKSLKYEPYRDKTELRELVTRWLQQIITRYIEPTTKMLFNMKDPQNTRYEVWFHCFGPTHDERKRSVLKRLWGDPTRRDSLLSGGWSGYKLLQKTFDALKPAHLKEAHIANFGRCYVGNSGERKVDGGKQPKLESSNLYLLDAPISRGGDMRECRLNWIMHEGLERLRGRLSPTPSVRMEVLDPSLPEDYDLASVFPSEVKKLKYNEGELMVATSAWDYGFIVRAPNPFCEDANTIALIMAGLHAPATHVAAEVFSVPARARKFAEYVQSQGANLLETDFFEAVFEVRRTYYQDDLGEIRWLHFRQLREKEPTSPSAKRNIYGI